MTANEVHVHSCT